MDESFKGVHPFFIFLTQKIWKKEKKYLPLQHQNTLKQYNIMCIILNSITESPKVVESDMITYKVLEVVEDEATGKESYYSPLSQNRLQYNIGELYTEPIGKAEDVQDSYDMVRGFEKCKYTKTTTGLYSYRDLDIAVLIMLSLKFGPSDTRYKIFQCKIPKGSKYYSSDKGTEIVSDNLEIVSQVD